MRLTLGSLPAPIGRPSSHSPRHRVGVCSWSVTSNRRFGRQKGRTQMPRRPQPERAGYRQSWVCRSLPRLLKQFLRPQPDPNRRTALLQTLLPEPCRRHRRRPRLRPPVPVLDRVRHENPAGVSPPFLRALRRRARSLGRYLLRDPYRNRRTWPIPSRAMVRQRLEKQMYPRERGRGHEIGRASRTFGSYQAAARGSRRAPSVEIHWWVRHTNPSVAGASKAASNSPGRSPRGWVPSSANSTPSTTSRR